MRKVVAAGAAAIVLLAGCGSDDDTPTSGSGTTPAASAPAATATSKTAEPSPDESAAVKLEGKVTVHDSADLPASGEIEMEVDDSYFEPTFVKTTAGAKVTVKLRREGSLPHTFTIDKVKVDQMLEPEATATVSFTMPDSGHLNFYCKFHRATGMQGAFYVG
jgi:plastocyanin